MEETNKIESKHKSKDIKDLVSTIQKRSVYGKVPEGTAVDGIVLEKASAPGMVGGYQEVGPDEIPENEDFDKVVSIVNTVARGKDVAKFVGVNLEPYINSDLFSVVQDGANAIVSLHFFQDTSERVPEGNRGHSLARFSVVMPYDEARNLVQMAQDVPDDLNAFFDMAFPGVQDDPENNRNGLRRIKTNGFFYLDPTHIALIPSNLDTRRVLDANETLKDLKYFSYKNGPYGIGEPFSEPK